MTNLPQEIITEILARLPVKSLLRFSCVSKAWLSLISSSTFIKTHLKSSTNNPSFSNHSMILTVSDYHSTVYLYSVPSSLLFQPLTVTPHVVTDYPPKNPANYLRVVGYCNGLVCIAVDKMEVFLWNPSTRKSKKLPDADVEFDEERCSLVSRWGFGFDESCDDYKVVGIFALAAYEDDWQWIIVKVYSLKAHSWKRIEDFEGEDIHLDDSCKFTNGKIHFISGKRLEDSVDDFRWDIVSLDLESEVYGIVEQPNLGEGYRVDILEVLGGCICVLCISRDDPNSDIWVLKDYSVRESWTKVASIPLSNDSKPRSLCMMLNGEILLIYGMHTAIYNPKGDCFRSLEVSNITGSIRRADIYVESLVNIHLSQLQADTGEGIEETTPLIARKARTSIGCAIL